MEMTRGAAALLLDHRRLPGAHDHGARLAAACEPELGDPAGALRIFAFTLVYHIEYIMIYIYV